MKETGRRSRESFFTERNRLGGREEVGQLESVADRSVGKLAAAACERLGISPPVPLAQVLATIRPHRAQLRREGYSLREFARNCRRAMPGIPVFSVPPHIREAGAGVDWADRERQKVAALARRLADLGFNNCEYFIKQYGADRVAEVLAAVEGNGAWGSKKAGVIVELRREGP
jgi:hypothetical protein